MDGMQPTNININEIGKSKEKGELYMWGDNEDNILGVGKDANTNKPVKLDIGYYIKSIACGFRHTFAITTNQQVLSWGYGRHGVLGHGNDDLHTSPTIIEFFKSTIPTSSSPMVHSLNNLSSSSSSFPSGSISSSINIIQIVSGGMHALALSDSGFIYSWGEGRYFKTGHSDESDISIPSQISALSSRMITKIACSSSATIVYHGMSFLIYPASFTPFPFPILRYPFPFSLRLSSLCIS